MTERASGSQSYYCWLARLRRIGFKKKLGLIKGMVGSGGRDRTADLGVMKAPLR